MLKVLSVFLLIFFSAAQKQRRKWINFTEYTNKKKKEKEKEKCLIKEI